MGNQSIKDDMVLILTGSYKPAHDEWLQSTHQSFGQCLESGKRNDYYIDP